MEFPKRLALLRKANNMSQQALAKKAGISVVQLQRYEADKSQPTLEVIKRLAVALGVSADVLIFEEHERDPGEDLRLQFERMNQFSADEKKVAKAVLEGLILKHEAKKWGSS
jgi:transcriptional regulator with XRE-family HTH domain